MNDEKVYTLLEEIRDLQKEQVENYKVSLKNQQEAIAIQKEAVARQKNMSKKLLTIVCIFFGLYLVLSFWR